MKKIILILLVPVLFFNELTFINALTIKNNNNATKTKSTLSIQSNKASDKQLSNLIKKYPNVDFLTHTLLSNDTYTKIDIIILQKELNAIMNCNLDTDGIIGPLTTKCIMDFQEKYNLSKDGLVGRQTQGELNKQYVLNKAIVSANELNIRNKAGVNGTNVIGKLTRGNIVTVLGTKKVNQEDWYHIKYNNIDGYVIKKYTKSTFIEIDIVSQTLRFYKNTKLFLDTPVTTGKKDGVHDTTLGYYNVMFIDTNRVLMPFQAFVNYWMRFNDAEALGIHDAPWRESVNGYYTYYGGTIYKHSGSAGSKYSGSHGCVNVPLKKMSILYPESGMNTPVYVH